MLEGNARWAVVKYNSPGEKPRKWRPLRGWFVVRNGQSFSAVGNVDCLSIRLWIYSRLISFPRKSKLQLAVRRLDKKAVPFVYTPTPEPNIIKAVSSNYKSVSSQRHFATELTAKGFRVGMISPDHTDMDNWMITLKTQ